MGGRCITLAKGYQRARSPPHAAFLRPARSACPRSGPVEGFWGNGSFPKGSRPVLVLGSANQRPGGGRVAGQREAHELLLIEEADAWFEYLEATRGQSVHRYKEVEPWAWARLTQRLRAIRTRRAKLKPAAEAA